MGAHVSSDPETKGRDQYGMITFRIMSLISSSSRPKSTPRVHESVVDLVQENRIHINVKWNDELDVRPRRTKELTTKSDSKTESNNDLAPSSHHILGVPMQPP